MVTAEAEVRSISSQVLVMMFFVAYCIVRAGSQVILVVLKVFVPQTTSISVATLLNTLSAVGDASGGVSWVDDVAFVACGTVQRFVSIFCRTAGFSL